MFTEFSTTTGTRIVEQRKTVKPRSQNPTVVEAVENAKVSKLAHIWSSFKRTILGS